MGQIVKDLPWVAIRRAGFQARKLVASKSRPSRDYLMVEMDREELVDILRKNHFREGWFLSYHYHGEDANLCRAEQGGGRYTDYQLHIRVFEMDSGLCELYCHYELCPIAHPRLHLQGKNQSVERGLHMTQEILEEEGVASVVFGAI